MRQRLRLQRQAILAGADKVFVRHPDAESEQFMAVVTAYRRNCPLAIRSMSQRLIPMSANSRSLKQDSSCITRPYRAQWPLADMLSRFCDVYF